MCCEDANVQNCDERHFPQTCTAVCYPGYFPSGDAEYTCSNHGTPDTQEGQWSGGSLACTAVHCASVAPEGVTHALDCEAADYQRPIDGLNPPLCRTASTEDAPCQQGYNQNVDQNMLPVHTDYSCDRTGNWTQSESPGSNHVPLRCTPKPCYGYPATVNGVDDPTHAKHDPHTLCTNIEEHPTGETMHNGDFDGALCT